MNERNRQAALDNQARMREYAGTPAPNVADELRGLAELHDSGVLTSDEYERAKTKVLAP